MPLGTATFLFFQQIKKKEQKDNKQQDVSLLNGARCELFNPNDREDDLILPSVIVSRAIHLLCLG